MPGLDRKGPNGEGPMSGRKMGRCTNFGEALKDNNLNDNRGTGEGEEGFFGRGYRRGRGRGFGWHRGKTGGKGLGNRNRFRDGE